MYIQSTLLSHLNFHLKKEKGLYKQTIPRPQATRALFYYKMIQSCSSVSKLKLTDTFQMLHWMWTYFENIVSGASLNDKSYSRRKRFAKKYQQLRSTCSAAKSVRNLSKLQKASQWI